MEDYYVDEIPIIMQEFFWICKTWNEYSGRNSKI